jgi:hypothetical protein
MDATIPLMGEDVDTESLWRWTRRNLSYALIALAATFFIAGVALYFALLAHRRTTTATVVDVTLGGDAEGPSGNNTLRTINPTSNFSCVDEPGTVEQCAWIDGSGRCNNPFCLPVNETFGPVVGPTINGTYPNISLIPIGDGGRCGDLDGSSGVRCSLLIDQYGLVTRIDNVSHPTFTPFNCTGGDVLCQVGRNSEGDVVLIEDGPTCLTTTTVFGGDLSGISTNLTLGNTGVTPGCYGNTSNNSFSFPRPCVQADGRITSITLQTFAFLLTNGTFALLNTANQTTVTDLGGNTLQVGTIQNNDKEADLQFKNILLSPHTSQTVNTVNSTYRLAILGTTGTWSTPLAGFYDTANTAGVPELQLGIWDESGDRHPFISFNTFWNPLTSSWINSKANTTGFVIFDPYADGTLYFVASGNATTANHSVALEQNIMRMTRTRVTSFLPLQVGVDAASMPLTSSETGVNIHNVGLSYADVGKLNMYMTYSGNYDPRFQAALSDVGNTYLLFEGYQDNVNGLIRASTASIPVGYIYYTAEGALHLGAVDSAGQGVPVSVADETLYVHSAYTEARGPLYVGASQNFPRALSMSALGQTNLTIGMGMYQDSAGFKFGNILGPAYAFWKINDKLSVLWNAQASPNSLITPTTLMYVTPSETAMYMRLSLYNTHADLWGFQGNTSTPQWQLYSDGPGEQRLLFDAYVDPTTGQVAPTSLSYTGASLYKQGDILNFQFYFARNATGFTDYHNVLSVSRDGVNLGRANFAYPGRGFRVDTLNSSSFVMDTFGAYFGAGASFRSGVDGWPTFFTEYFQGTWSIQRCDAVGLGAVISSCTEWLGIGLTGNLIINPNTTFYSPVLLAGTPQLSTALLVGSGGSGSTTALVGNKFMISEAPGPVGGKMVESSVDANLDEDSIAPKPTLNNVVGTGTISFGSSSILCSAGEGAQTTYDAEVSFYRITDQITVTLTINGTLYMTGTCAIFRVSVDLSAFVARFPSPLLRFCLLNAGQGQGVGSGATAKEIPYGMCINPTDSRVDIFPYVGGERSFYTANVLWTLPQTMSWTYIAQS